MALTKIGTDGIKDDAVTTDKVANAINTSIAANTAKDLTALSASNLTSGTIPDARFPATLPAASAANLTAVPAANITGTLPAISGANLTSLPAANLTGTLPAISGANLTGISSAGRAHNLMVNGACLIAQRAASSTSSLYATVDRFRFAYALVDENPTTAHVDVSSGTTPYTLGFRKAVKITNGNQSSGAGTSDRIAFEYRIEAQDIANSGWNYVSASSNITLSFWIKSSVAQNFYFYFETADGTAQIYPMETGSLSADTWTKITKTIPGNSNLQFDNNQHLGLKLYFSYFTGTDYTNNSQSLNAWGAYSSASRFPDNTSTWYTTDNATVEMTGFQLEVGDSATDFEHLSYQENLTRCRRYCFAIQESGAPLGDGGAVTMTGNDGYIAYGQAVNGANPIVTQIFYPPMRATPSLSDSGNQFKFWRGHAADIPANGSGIFTESIGCSPMHFRYGIHSAGGMTNGDAGMLTFNGSGGYIIFSAEL